MNRLIASVSIATLAALTASNAFAAVGRTTGSLAVSSSGSATYTIPIWIPPGPRGLQPHLSLAYSSSISKGPLGVGWSLAGLSAIARCNKTVAQDGVPAAIALTTSDALCLDGKRLRQIAGATAGTYDTEVAEFMKVSTVGTVGNATYFTVQEKGGLTYEFGNGGNSRVLASGTSTASMWMLSKITDCGGNTMTVSYAAPDGSLSGSTVPDTISWTPTSSGSGSYAYTVHFNYAGNAPESSIVGYVAGTTVLNADLLANIVVAHNGSTIKKYVLTYEVSPTTGSQRLRTVRECSDDAASDCLSPTTIGYQNGTSGTVTSATGSISGNFPGLTARYDFNGDGFLDLAYKNGSSWYVAWGSPSGFGTGFNTGITGDINVSTLFGDVRGKGIDSILAVSGTTWLHYAWDPASSAFVSSNTQVPFDSSAKGAALVDANGDGRPDLLLEDASFSIVVRPNTSSGGTVSFDAPITSYSAAAEYGDLGITSALPYGSDAELGRVRHVDLNGDGREDFALILAGCTPAPIGCQPWSYIVPLLAGDNYTYSSSNYAIPFPTGALKLYYTNWNNDSCTDIATSSAIYIWPCTGSAPAQINLSNIVGTVDWDGDGRMDVVTAATSDTTLTVYRSTGSGLSAAIPTSVPYAFGCRVVTLDADSDGLDDVSCYRVIGTQGFTYYLHNSPTVLPDLAISFGDGFDVTNTVSYGPANWNNHTKSSDAVYPNVDYQGPMYLARSTTSSDGVTPTGTYTTSYWYYGGKTDLTGRDFSGFASQRTIDSRNSLQTFDYFKQTFPLTGNRWKTDVYQGDGATLISTETLTPTSVDADTPASNVRFLVYVSGTTGSRYEVGGPANGNLITQFSNTYTPDAVGNITGIQLSVTDKDSNSPNANKVYTTSTALTITPDTGSNWCLDQPTNLIVTYTATGSPTVVRTNGFSVDYAHCRAYQQIVEPNSAIYKVTRTFGFDSFGNVNSIATVGRNPDGTDMATRTELMDWGATGQFPMTATNALSQQTTFGYNFDFGIRTSVTDPNGIARSQVLDAYGRPIQVNHPDGTYVSVSYGDCASVAGGCQNGDPASAVTGINRLVTIAMSKAVGGAVIRDDWTYADQLGRTIVTKSKTLGGSYSRIGTQYDALGRVARQTMPCDAASCSVYWATTGYDAINRVTSQQRPISEANLTLQTTTAQYLGRTTIFTDPQGKTSARIEDVHGNLERTQDHDNYYQHLSYDAYGSLLSAVDSQSATLFSASYNYGLAAFQTSSTDSDLGAKSQTFDSLGELVAYSDARGQTFSVAYDALSRPTQRTEPDLTTVWTWGTTAASHDIGALAQVSAGSHVEAYAYDSTGRQSSRTVTIPSDGSYTFDMTYNGTTGLLDTLTYPTSTGGYRLKLQYAYQNGILKSVSDANATSTVFWTANTANVRGQVTQETLGNGVINNRAFDAVTGWLSSISSGTGGGAALQNESYLHDQVGNVIQRQNNNVGLTENFYYDNLYRLEHSVLGATTNLTLTYDPTGNITSRTDLASGASWTYGSSRRHAVTQAGSAAYTYNYDANGNVTSRSGFTIDWTSYNHPGVINGLGGESVQFSYDQDHQRWRAAYNGSNGIETTYFIGDLLEKVVTTGNNDFRHYILAGGARVAIYSRTTAGANTLKYLGTDHLGSVASIINDDGTGYVKESFTAFGARRNSCTWSGSPTQGNKDLINAVTRHGYTWHMALADMGLNDMNGRIQDALTGRFLSPDPTIPEPLNTQDYNRFSYVRNNPLTFTDPTGFEEEMQEAVVTGTRTVDTGISFGGGFQRQAMNDERASGLDPKAYATAPFAWTPPMQQVKVTAAREKEKPGPKPGVKSCTGPNCILQARQGTDEQCRELGEAAIGEGSEQHEHLEEGSNAAAALDLTGSTAAHYSEHLVKQAEHLVGRPPETMRMSVPTRTPYAPTLLSKNVWYVDQGVLGGVMHTGGRFVGGVGAGFDFVNAYDSYSAGDNLSGTLDMLSGGLTVAMIAQPEITPLALPTWGALKLVKPSLSAAIQLRCMGVGYAEPLGRGVP